jgi:hypothetical protein
VLLSVIIWETGFAMILNFFTSFPRTEARFSRFPGLGVLETFREELEVFGIDGGGFCKVDGGML